MKKIILLLAIVGFASVAHASKLSHYIQKQKDRERARVEADDARLQAQVRQDTNFADFAFRFEKSYVDNNGQQCRDYIIRSRSNPFRHGYYTVCDER